jgi:hypothetical protein
MSAAVLAAGARQAQQRLDVIPTLGLAALYDLTALTAGTQVVTDSSGNNKHGTLGGSSAVEAADATITPTGLVFDGVDDYAALPVNNPATFTLTVAATRANTAANHAYVGASGTGGTLLRSSSGGNNLVFYPSSSTALIVTAAVPMLTPKLITVTFDGVSFVGRMYVNGSLVAQNTSDRAPSTALTLAFGRRQASEFLNGTVHYGVLHTRILDDTEIVRMSRKIRRYLVTKGIAI